jgi:hypothetical protein
MLIHCINLNKLNYRRFLKEEYYRSYILFEIICQAYENNSLKINDDDIVAICTLNEQLPSDFPEYCAQIQQYIKIYEMIHEKECKGMREFFERCLIKRETLLTILKQDVHTIINTLEDGQELTKLMQQVNANSAEALAKLIPILEKINQKSYQDFFFIFFHKFRCSHSAQPFRS